MCDSVKFCVFFGFWEFSQKPPGGLHIAARRLMLYYRVSGLPRGTAWRWCLIPPGDANW